MDEKNLVLIGMSGCGKSRLAKILAKRLKRQAVDIDKNIVAAHGNITELFQIGEQYFRDIETEEIRKIKDQTGCVIATGGGVILREENMRMLQENGIVVYIKRSVKSIIESSNLSGRPLLQGGMDSAVKLFQSRRKLYEKYADITVANEGNIYDAAGEIVRKVKRYRG